MLPTENTPHVFAEHISTATQQQSTLSWQPGMDSCSSSMAQQQVEPAQHSTMDSSKGHKEAEDVELMSSDTSSSSSSDEWHQVSYTWCHMWRVIYMTRHIQYMTCHMWYVIYMIWGVTYYMSYTTPYMSHVIYLMCHVCDMSYVLYTWPVIYIYKHSHILLQISQWPGTVYWC